MAVQLGAAFGARVFTTAGSAEKVAFARDLGAEVSIDYREQDFVEVVRDVTDGRGVDVVLDIVGGDYIARDLAALATGGRIMSIANRGSAPSTIDVGLLMRKRARLWGTTLRARPLDERVAIIADLREKVWPLIASGRVHPVIDSVFPLEDAPQAHRRMESSNHLGKILLQSR
jgi:NADPH:quinone reductase-like Zn-dependent oxidoreductase